MLYEILVRALPAQTGTSHTSNCALMRSLPRVDGARGLSQLVMESHTVTGQWNVSVNADLINRKDRNPAREIF